MKYLLDTNIIIAASLGLSRSLKAKMAACDEGDLVTSAIVYAELVFGSVRDKPPPLDRLEALIEEVPVLAFDQSAARIYATFPFQRASYDQLIAAHARSLNLILVTDNERHFATLPGLSVENWLR